MTERRRADPLPLGGDDGLPYSKGLMARALMATGVSAVRAYELAARVEADLLSRGETAVDLGRLEELAIEVLGENEGAQALRRLRRHETLRELDLPIILLIGGATGTGKSTVATEVAYRLGIRRCARSSRRSSCRRSTVRASTFRTRTSCATCWARSSTRPRTS
jgi:2-phosphoglycerate kinase